MSTAALDYPPDVLVRSKELRVERDPLRYFGPASDQQEALLRCASKGRIGIGGNRSGKTVAGAVETAARLTGTHPYKQVRRARRAWCVSQELPGASVKPHVQLEAMRRWLPVGALKGGSWYSAYSPGSRVLSLEGGGKIEFKSYDQDLLAFESAAVDWIWFDEEPTRREIWSSCLLRLVDRRGQWMMTLTPVLSLEGKSGIAEELWEARGERAAEYECFQLFTSANVHLPADEVSALDTLPEEEKQVRLYGAFARLGGRVLSEFDPKVHVVHDFKPPRDWRHIWIIDPGWHKTAVLLAAVDPEARCWIFDEYYEGERRPAEHFETLNAWWHAYDRPEVEVLMDPAGFNIKRTTTGRESPSDKQEWQEAADAIGAAWFRPSRANNGDPMAWLVKRYLAARMLFVSRQCRWWLWEQERWTRQKDLPGPRASERAVPDAPIDRFNHLMDCTRYLCNLLPDPLPPPEPDPPTPLEKHWARATEARRESEEVREWV